MTHTAWPILRLGGMHAIAAKMLGSRASVVPPKAKNFFDFPSRALKEP